MPVRNAIIQWIKKFIGLPTTNPPNQPEHEYVEIVHLPSIGHSLTNPTGPSWTILPVKHSLDTTAGNGNKSQPYGQTPVGCSIVKFIGYIITCRICAFTTRTIHSEP
jgi:hypothetical protein